MRSKRVQVKCNWCGKEFNRKPSQVKKYSHNFCSRECLGRSRGKYYGGHNSKLHKKVLIECNWCGKKLERKPSRIRKRNFCSRKCMVGWLSVNMAGENSPAWNGGRITITCEYCGKNFKAKRGAKDKTRFCSRRCWGKWLSENQSKGENHPSWKGGKGLVKCDYCGRIVERYTYQIERYKNHFCSAGCRSNWLWRGERKGYYGPNWGGQRIKARRRDDYTCNICGVRENGRALDVHHIIPFREFRLENYEEANQLPNLITLCRPCHEKADHEKILIDVLEGVIT